MSWSVGRRHGLDLVVVWLCCRLGVTALIQALAWERPYAAGVALKRSKKLCRHLTVLLHSVGEECTCHLSQQRVLLSKLHSSFGIFDSGSKGPTNQLLVGSHPRLAPEGIQDGEKQDTGPRELRCIFQGKISRSPDFCISHT